MKMDEDDDDDDDDDECGAVRLMIGRRNLSTWRNSAPVPHCPPQLRHDLTWARPRTATVGSRLLTT
jgi:hypothetical protein